MRLTNFSLGNFKSFGQRPQVIPLRPITLIFGPNSAGKSSCIKGFKYILEEFVQPIDLQGRPIRPILDLQAFASFVHKQKESTRILLGINLKQSDSVPSHKNHLPEELNYQWTVGTRPGFKPHVMDIVISAQEREICKLSHKQHEWSVDYIDIEHPALLHLHKDVSEGEIDLDSIKLKAWFSGVPLKVEAIKSASNAMRSLAGYLSDLILELWRYLGDISSDLVQIPPMRQVPSRDADFRNLGEPWSLLANNETLTQVNRWLSQDHLQTRYEVIIEDFFRESSITGKQEQFEKQCVAHLLANHQEAFFSEEHPLRKVFNEFRVFLEEGTPRDFLKYIEKEMTPYVWEMFCDCDYKSPQDAMLDEEWDDREDLLEQCLVMVNDYEKTSGKKWVDAPCSERNDYFYEAIKSAVIEEMSVNMQLFFRWEDFYYGHLPNYLLFKNWLKDHPDFNHFLDGGIPGQLDDIESFASLIGESAGVRDSIQKMYLEDTQRHTTHTLEEVGYGVSQVLPVLIHSFGTKSRLISIEQPEIHIHPALQAELGDVFIESALGENKNTFLLETHSEHLILRLLRRIRETTEGEMQDWPEDLRKACPNGIRPEDVAVLYVEPGTEGAKVQCLRINELGEFIDEWPKGFFEERIREVL
jgi:hypothetical protein